MKITVKKKLAGNKELAPCSDWALKARAKPKEAHTSHMSYRQLCENLRVERRVSEALRRAASAWKAAAFVIAGIAVGLLVLLGSLLPRG